MFEPRLLPKLPSCERLLPTPSGRSGRESTLDPFRTFRVRPKADIDSAVECGEASLMCNRYSMTMATVPHCCDDQVMRLGWKMFLSFSRTWVVLVSGWLMLTRYGA
jgi:hypothetical protein